MAIIAGLFDSDADATQAMDRLMRENIHDLETKVIEPGRNFSEGGSDRIFPVIPNTGGNYAGAAGGSPGGPLAAGGGNDDWLNELDKVEGVFYNEGLKEGAVLAMARVPDEEADHVRMLMRTFGARTYEKK